MGIINHTNNLTFVQLNEKSTLSRGLLDDLYKSIERSPNKPKWCYFQGIKYKVGSKNLKKALDRWYGLHSKDKQ